MRGRGGVGGGGDLDLQLVNYAVFVRVAKCRLSVAFSQVASCVVFMSVLSAFCTQSCRIVVFAACPPFAD